MYISIEEEWYSRFVLHNWAELRVASQRRMQCQAVISAGHKRGSGQHRKGLCCTLSTAPCIMLLKQKMCLILATLRPRRCLAILDTLPATPDTRWQLLVRRKEKWMRIDSTFGDGRFFSTCACLPFTVFYVILLNVSWKKQEGEAPNSCQNAKNSDVMECIFAAGRFPSFQSSSVKYKLKEAGKSGPQPLSHFPIII